VGDIQVLHHDAVEVARAVLIAGYAARGITRPVSSRIPNPRPDRFTRVARSGGVPNTDVSDAARLTVESWGPDAATCAADAALVQALLRQSRHTVVEGVTVSRVRVAGGPSDFPDPLSHHDRCVQTIEFTTRGSDFI
jgi:hypothetical protein